jgi:hypothetical protein
MRDNPNVRQALSVLPSEPLAATTDLLTSFARPLSRRWLLRGAVAGSTGAVLATTGVLKCAGSPCRDQCCGLASDRVLQHPGNRGGALRHFLQQRHCPPPTTK